MKGKTFLLISIMMSILFAGCSDFTVPKGVAVEASPKIEASTGSIDIDMSNLIDIGSILKSSLSSDKDSGILCYDYYSNAEDTDRQQKFLFYYPLMSQDLDIGKYLEDVDFDSGFNKAIEKNEFDIPEINGTENISPIDIPASDTDITAEDLSGTFKVIELGNPDPLTNDSIQGSGLENLVDTEAFNSINVNCSADVDSIKFRSGYIRVVFAPITDNGGPGTHPVTGEAYELNLTSLQFIGKNDAVITSAAGNFTLVDGETINLPLADKTIDMTEGHFSIKADVSMKGGYPGKSHYISVSAEFVDIEVAAVTKAGGIFEPVDIGGENGQTVDIGDAASSFESAVIGQGNITIDFRKDGVNPFAGIGGINLNIEVAQDGNQVIAPATYSFADGVIVMDLAGKTIINKNLVVKGSVYSADTLTLGEGAEIPSKISPVVTYGIQNFESVSVKLPDDLKTSYEIKTDVPAELKKWVSEITFPAGGCGIELTFDNNLPVDIETNVVSSAFNIDASKVFYQGEPATEVFSNAGAFSLKPSEIADGQFDVTVNIDFGSNYNPDTNTLTLYDIDAGASYSIEGNANVIMEFDSITVAPPAEEGGIAGSYPDEDSDPLDLSGLTSILGEGLALPQFETYLYVSSPSKENMSGADMTISLGAEYKKGEENVLLNLVNGENYTGELQSFPVEVVDPLVFNKDSEKFTGPLSMSSLKDTEGNSLALTGISKMINDGASDLRMNYAFSLEGFTLTKAQIEEAESTALSVSLVMIIPVGIDVVGVNAETGEKEAILDLSKLMSSDDEETPENEESGETEEGGNEGEEETVNDLFGRSEEDKDQFSEIGDYMKAISLRVLYDNDCGISGTLRITNDAVYEGRTFVKDITLKNGKGEWNLGLSEADCKYIMSAYPFDPKIQFVLFEDQKIYRDGKITLSLIGSISTEINKTFDFSSSGSDDSNEEEFIYGGEE